jgi:hypothetical protein
VASPREQHEAAMKRAAKKLHGQRPTQAHLAPVFKRSGSSRGKIERAAPKRLDPAKSAPSKPKKPSKNPFTRIKEILG